MGMRTEHQIDPKAQLVVQISRDAARTACEADQSQFLDESGISSDTLQLSADSDSSRNVLERIRFIDSAGMYSDFYICIVIEAGRVCTVSTCSARQFCFDKQSEPQFCAFLS